MSILATKATEKSHLFGNQGVFVALVLGGLLIWGGCGSVSPNGPATKGGEKGASEGKAGHLETSAQPPLAPDGPPKAADSADPPTAEVVPPGPIQFRDVTRESGIDFVHTDGSSGRRYIVETVASGMASFDYDGDGLIDIYFCNGAPLGGAPEPDVAPQNRLYKNLGGFLFIDVTDEAGVGDPRYSLGATVGDYNEDGYPDLYVSNYGPNTMYANNGDGTFTRTEEEAGTALPDPEKVGAGPAFFDFDDDGDLDLFVANYMKFSPSSHVEHQWKGVTIYSGPLKYPFYPSHLLRNEGDGSFTDVSQESGIQKSLGHGMGMVCSDIDDDGDLDVFVNNDGSPGNFLFRNEGNGQFVEVAAASGTAYSADGLALGSMGVDSGDFDNDGRLDFYVTAYQDQVSRLFRNRGGGLFEDVTRSIGAGMGTYNRVTWGCSFGDFDNDGWRDLFLACGHLIDNVIEVDDTTTYAQTPIVMRNVNGEKFDNVSRSCGAGLQQPLVGRGASFDDFDNDGRVDVAILNSRRPAVLLANESPTEGNWLQLSLIGRAKTRDAVGARVKVLSGGAQSGSSQQVAEVQRGKGYQGHFGSRLQFGMGSHRHADRVEIKWPGGAVEVLENVPAGQLLTVVEGQGAASASKLQ